MLSLLRTKLELPPVRAQHIYRERLMFYLDRARNSDTRLTLVSAPAGFGKSSCLIAWAHRLRQEDTLVAWYALDDRDNDAARFTGYLVEAFRSLRMSFPSLPEDHEQIGLHEAISYILNAAATLNNPVILILDDYHLIVEPRIHEAISMMVEYLPENMRLVISTRADPPLQLARLRTHGTITEVRMADLRFNTEEMSRWLQATLGWTPSVRLLQQLETLTEGWAAALSLIMMSHPQAGENALENQLTRYSLSRRHIFDYFAQEVFDQQSEMCQEFLLDTCVLNWMHPELCQTMTGSPNARLLLSQLAADSLFILPLSDTDPIYRYHHLFEQFLRQQLETVDRQRYLDKHRLAAEWHSAHDHIVEAVQHGLASEDFSYAAQLIENRAWKTMTSRGEIMTIMSWLPHFQPEVLKRRPRLCLYFSRALYLTGDLERSRSYLRLVTETLDDETSSIQERDALQTIAFNYQATLAASEGDLVAGLHWINRANALRDCVEPLDRVRIANTHAFLHYLMGDVPAARHAYEYALELAQQIHHHYLMLDAHFYLAQIDLLAGELGAVQDRYEAVMAAYPTRIGPLSALMLPQAQVLYQRNRLVDAETTLRDAITLAHKANITDILWLACVTLAEVLLSRGRSVEAAASFSQAYDYARGYRSPMMAAFIGAAEARFMLRSGQMDRAAEWAMQYEQMEPGGYHQDYENITLARIWFAQGKHEQVVTLAAQVSEGAQAAGRIGYVIPAELLKALAHQAAGETEAALSALELALSLARPHDFVRLFLDAGQPILRLLHQAVERDVDAEYAAYLLSIATHSDPAQHPADALTEREIEVLKHIAEGASNQEIAVALVLSLGTVKSHIHHIMNKLDAHNRTEAVSKARSLNLFPG